MNAHIIPLQQLYLSTIVAIANADKLEAVQQELGQDMGRLWLVREGSTVPVMQVSYKFGADDVALEVIHRDERHFKKLVKYAEGLDGFVEEFHKFTQANRLAAPKSTKTRPLAVV